MPTDPDRTMGRSPIAALLRAALRRSPDQVRHVSPVRSAGSAGLLGQVLDQAEREFGLAAPPLTLHSAVPELAAASWLMLRETLVADGAVPRVAKEAVAATVSVANSCPYCVEVHGAAVHSMADGSQATALRTGQLADLTDPFLRDLANWLLGGAGRPAGDRPPFTAEQAPEVIGVAVTFQYLNRMVNAFLADSPLPAALPAGARARAGRVLGWYLRNSARSPHPPGASLRLLPAAPVPADLNWAAGNPFVTEAFARAAAAVDAAADRCLPGPVRELVLDRLADWDGTDPGLDRAWLDRAVASLPATARPSGQLAMLTAFASYRIDQQAIDGYRSTEPSDQALLGLTSWVSLAAARRSAAWLIAH